jgi:transcription initiation factor TFIIIB Brf1 subunit/transcription initiation factor TFIIB
VHRASDQVEHADWIEDLRRTADELGLGDAARSCAIDLFLANVPDAERSKPAVLAASLYAGALVAGEERPQTEVAEAVGVSRLTVQNRWKPILEAAGFDSPSW